VELLPILLLLSTDAEIINQLSQKKEQFLIVPLPKNNG
jgi:hypothetical protein